MTATDHRREVSRSAHDDHPSLLAILSHQPRTVWITAFAAVIAFMGIGLVDPILTSIAESLHATPAQTTLLFSSYLGVQVVAMLITGWAATRFGAKRTVITGLVLIVISAALCAMSSSIGELVLLRAFWGLGNALFIATALSVIVGAAKGGQSGAILLYEAALGLGIAIGPLIGAALGGISWRGPFAGTAVLMAIGAVMCAIFLPSDYQATRARLAHTKPTSVIAPLKALRHRSLFLTGLGAALYTAGFFTILAWTPFVLHKSAYVVGAIFFGWGLFVAVSGVLLAPRVAAWLGDRNGSIAAVLLYAVLLAVAAIWCENIPVVITVVVLSGIPSGILNTLFTGTAMALGAAPRPVASAGYNFLRWAGGALAATFVAHIANWFNSPAAPFYVGAIACLLAAGVVAGVRRNPHAVAPVDAVDGASEM